MEVTHVLVERRKASASLSGCVGVDADSSGSVASLDGVDAAEPQPKRCDMGKEWGRNHETLEKTSIIWAYGIGELAPHT